MGGGKPKQKFPKLRSFYKMLLHAPFNLNDLLMSLVRQLEDSKTSGEKELAIILEGKKYLIVLDDVLSTTEWNALNNFSRNGKGKPG